MDHDTAIAAWVDRTRIVVSEDAPKAVDKFLEYWGCFYHIGVERRKFEPGELDDRQAALLEEHRTQKTARAERFAVHITDYAKRLRKGANLSPKRKIKGGRENGEIGRAGTPA